MKNKKAFCFILVLILTFIVISCSKSGGSGTTANAQSNTQGETSGVMVAQSSNTGSDNIESSDRRFVEEKYRGVFICKGEPDDNGHIVGDKIEFGEDYMLEGSWTNFAGESWKDDSGGFVYTNGNKLFTEGDGETTLYGTFTDVNTFVLDGKLGELLKDMVLGYYRIFKREQKIFVFIVFKK